MGKLFASLYLYIIVSLFIASGVIERIWPYEESRQELILGKDVGLLLEALLKSEGGLQEIARRYPTDQLSINQLSLPVSQLAKLSENKVIQVYGPGHYPMWYLPMEGEQVLRVGPMAKMPQKASFWAYLIVLTLLGAPVGLWSFLIWRDFLELRKACEELEGHPEADIHSTSRSIFLPIADALSAMQKRIKSLLSAQRELTSSVSHEFRTPLARLKFAIAMLESKQPDEKQQNYLNNMQADVAELEGLVSEMMQYARLDSEQPELNIRATDLAQLVRGVVEKLSFDSKVDIISQIEGPMLCPCDGHFVARSIQNLIGNARKHAKSKIDISLTRENGYCVISVGDDGPGIDPEQWEHLFKPFTRLDKSRDKRTGGYGLGLAIVDKIVQWHGGYCEVRHSGYGGACFSIYLPIQAGPATTLKP